jgi:XTP/dITP diphosphohydrolase
VRRLVIATRNLGKAKEIELLLQDSGFEIRSLRDYPSAPEPEETGESFGENAAIKALAAAEHTGELAIADDSGLVIDALDGAPGVYSSRFAGEGATDEERNAKIFDLMKDVPDEKRTARFIAVAAIAEPHNLICTALGVVEGFIAREPMGSNGFGYDPIFWLPENGRTMAQLSPDEKNRISHRGKAFRTAIEIIGDSGK